MPIAWARPSSNCSGASPGMWQFWQRGCWSTARTVSNAATPSSFDGAAAGDAAGRSAAAAASTAAAENAARPYGAGRVGFIGLASQVRSGEPEREPAQPLARGGEDGVGDGGRDGRHAHLADPARL